MRHYRGATTSTSLLPDATSISTSGAPLPRSTSLAPKEEEEGEKGDQDLLGHSGIELYASQMLASIHLSFLPSTVH